MSETPARPGQLPAETLVRFEGGEIVIDSSAESPTELIFSVWNEGAGFDPKSAEGLFTRFHRLAAAGPNTKSGTGLGLFVTKQIVEKHGGRIWAESDPGKWARFSFSLPKGLRDD
jgi:signal transduction histidine kinase